MNKAIVKVGYKEYIVDADKALAIADALADAEIYEACWHRPADGRDAFYTYHVYAREHDEKFQIDVISTAHYNMSKVAGRPGKE